MSFAGRLLVATPMILDPNFHRTAVYLYAHVEDEGAAGVIVNRPTDEPAVEHLPGWRSVLAAPPNVFWGGPVAPTSPLVVLVEDDDVVLAESLEPPSGKVKARLFVGQAGWGPGQLEAEIAEGAWVLTDAGPDSVVAPFPDLVWSEALRRHGGSAALWATMPRDPSLN